MKKRTKVEIYGEMHTHVKDIGRELEYTFTCDFLPLRAEGTVRGRAFVFLSRDGRYQFAISEDENVSPSKITDNDSGFYINAEYTDRDEMSLSVAEEIIERLTDQYLKKLEDGSSFSA